MGQQNSASACSAPTACAPAEADKELTIQNFKYFCLELEPSDDHVVHAGGADIGKAAPRAREGSKVRPVGNVVSRVGTGELWLFGDVVAVPTDFELHTLADRELLGER